VLRWIIGPAGKEYLGGRGGVLSSPVRTSAGRDDFIDVGGGEQVERLDDPDGNAGADELEEVGVRRYERTHALGDGGCRRSFTKHHWVIYVGIIQVSFELQEAALEMRDRKLHARECHG
jgi:hypothetical protein